MAYLDREEIRTEKVNANMIALAGIFFTVMLAYAAGSIHIPQLPEVISTSQDVLLAQRAVLLQGFKDVLTYAAVVTGAAGAFGLLRRGFLAASYPESRELHNAGISGSRRHSNKI